MSEKNEGTEASPDACFETALADLETIVGELEDGEVGLAEALARYESGVKLLRQCFGLLERAERRIEMLSGVDADGAAITVPFDAEATFAAESSKPAKPARRSRTTSGRKSAAEPPPPDESSDGPSLF